MKAIGIDPSLTGTGVCCLADDDTGVWVETFGSDACDGLKSRFERYRYLIASIFDEMPLATAEVVCIEGYSYGSTGGKQLDRIEYGAMLRDHLLVNSHFNDARIFEVAPTTLKLFIAGHGHADKTALALATFKRWGQEFRDSDQVDAHGLARMAACIAGFEQPANDAQRRAVDTVVNGKQKSKKARKSA